MVWANTNKMGCAINKCSNMNVYGSSWRTAVFLVCNYSIKGNWVGEAPYKSGKPCSACPSKYGGSCNRNQCSFSGSKAKAKKIKRYQKDISHTFPVIMEGFQEFIVSGQLFNSIHLSNKQQLQERVSVKGEGFLNIKNESKHKTCFFQRFNYSTTIFVFIIN